MRIREIREDKDLTQSDIAKILNISLNSAKNAKRNKNMGGDHFSHI